MNLCEACCDDMCYALYASCPAASWYTQYYLSAQHWEDELPLVPDWAWAGGLVAVKRPCGFTFPDAIRHYYCATKVGGEIPAVVYENTPQFHDIDIISSITPVANGCESCQSATYLACENSGCGTQEKCLPWQQCPPDDEVLCINHPWHSEHGCCRGFHNDPHWPYEPTEHFAQTHNVVSFLADTTSPDEIPPAWRICADSSSAPCCCCRRLLTTGHIPAAPPDVHGTATGSLPGDEHVIGGCGDCAPYTWPLLDGPHTPSPTTTANLPRDIIVPVSFTTPDRVYDTAVHMQLVSREYRVVTESIELPWDDDGCVREVDAQLLSPDVAWIRGMSMARQKLVSPARYEFTIHAAIKSFRNPECGGVFGRGRRGVTVVESSVVVEVVSNEEGQV